jgi:quercetin dioxygenase-like cupin family protein
MSVTQHQGSFRWENLDLLKYKEEGCHFRDITRQLLYKGRPELDVQLRYFEIGPGGHSTLERHNHVHVVMIMRGSGEGLVEGHVHRLSPFDVVEIPPRSWHQFRATSNETFGFLCLVRTDRDHPELPTAENLADLKANKEVADFIRI